MYARVVRWEGGDAEAMRQAAEEINRDADAGPPEGVPAKGFLMLNSPESGASLGIVLFETEDDYRQGHEALEGMSPPGDGFGRRVSVEKFEVGAQLET